MILCNLCGTELNILNKNCTFDTYFLKSMDDFFFKELEPKDFERMFAVWLLHCNDAASPKMKEWARNAIYACAIKT